MPIPMRNNTLLKPYNIVYEGDDGATIDMYGEVMETRPIDFWTGQPVPGNFILLDEFLNDLKSLEGKSSITVHINSVGGEGFTAILMSWLGQFNPFIMVIMTAIVVFLELGVAKVADTALLNSSYADIMVGIVILMLVGCEFFIRYSIKFKHKKEASV